MSDSTSEHQLPANGFVPSPFWADPVPAAGAAASIAPVVPDAPATPGAPTSSEVVAEAVTRDDAALTTALRELLRNVPPQRSEPPFERADTTVEPLAGEPGQESAERDPQAGSDAGDELSLDDLDLDLDDLASDAEDEDPEALGDEESDEDAADDEAESEAVLAQRTRFDELVEERVRRARYAHHLTRAVFTPGESATAVIVEKRAAVWVPTLTFVATLVSAAAAVVLATRLHGDPADPTGHQLLIVMITVCLLAAAFGILLRAEVHYERLRPRGRTVRHDIADAYEIVRDAPRRLVRNDAPLDVLRGVSDLLPAAEQMVDALVEYAAEGGSRVREHPAYERILRMRAEVEALEVILAEREERDLQEELGRKPRTSDVRVVSTDGTPLPRPEQVADYAGLANLAASLDPDD